MTRTQAICYLLGYQGGTVHQIAEELNLPSSDILYAEPQKTGEYHLGWYVVRYMPLEYCRQFLFPTMKGKLEFWLGAAESKMIEHALESRF